jgi:two-component system sensor histidine kinase PilS (NtrC family)
LHRLQQFQREILDNMNNGFLIADLNGTIRVVNKAAERILNLSEDEAIGEPVQEILRVASGEECPVITALRSERDFTRYEYAGLVNPGKTMLLGLSTSRIYDWRGRMTGIIASFSDLTELEQIRQELKRQDRLSIVGELAAGLAHEIRNPVAAIRGAVDELSTSLEQPVVAEKLVAIALRESDQLNAIVTDFLDFARKPRMRRDVFDVRGLIEEVADFTQRKYADSPEFTVVTEVPREVCPVSGDRSQIRQVFVNLAKNAAEAMNERGRLLVAASLGPSSVEVRFDDEGPGIEPDKVARIFEPFYTTKDTGVGMGLAICLRIVSAHDGTIRAASREGGGATMSVRLPRAGTEE